MYLIDTNVVSEARKGPRANPGVKAFLRQAAVGDDVLYLSAVTIGDLRRGVELIRRRGEHDPAALLESWLDEVLRHHGERILGFDAESAQVWGTLSALTCKHELDRQVAAIALVNDLTVVTRNTPGFGDAGVRLMNPFAPD